MEAAAATSTSVASVAEEDEKNWEDVLRTMLPPGAPVPDQDQLDYSIAIEYDGPPISSEVPKIEPLNPHSLSHHHNRTVGVGSNPDSKFSPKTRPRFKKMLHTAESLSPGGSSRYSSVVPSAGEEEEGGANSRVSSLCLQSPSQMEVRRNPIVTFRSAEVRNEGVDVDLQEKGKEIYHSKSWPSTAVVGRKKKRACCRCGRLNVLLEREACIVCDAKYCSSCLLKAMGSMPEGRKCVTCIGRPINELKRPLLGKSSRMLCRVCNPLEIKQIMKAEKECYVNQLRPEQLFVNGRQLRQEELDEIMGCPNPPVKLKPGRYWYDKDSGLWGKEGEKPDKIITSKLNVGGALQQIASNGRTGVLINGREITKTELRMLKLSKVQCPRDTAFWVYDDGSYEEEGQNNIKGNIWGKASTRLLCSLLSLPSPRGNPLGSNEDTVSFSNRSVPEYLEQKRVQKLILLGLEGSGTSTIFKQAKLLYGNKYSPEELQDIKLLIQKNMYIYLGVLLEARERFEEEDLEQINNHLDGSEPSNPENKNEATNQCVFSINQRLKHFSDWLLEIMAMGDLEAFFPAATREYAPVVDEVWKDPAVQETYKRRNELHSFPDAAKYFLDRAIEISSNEYEPSEKDILLAEGVDMCNAVACLDFSLDDQSPMSESYSEHFEGPPPLIKYQLIRVNSKGLGEGCKWLEMFEDSRAVIFGVSLSDYDQVWYDESGAVHNRMKASRNFFESLIKHPSFRKTPFILLLNKYDIFEEKINNVPLTVCDWFEDFNPVRAHNTHQYMANHAYHYIAVKFKDLYSSITDEKLFVWPTKTCDNITVDEAFKYIREVLRWDEIKNENLNSFGDDSFYSTDAGSSSPFTQQDCKNEY